MATTQQLQAWLAEAEQARHELLLGVRAVSVSTGSGKSVTYTATDIGKIDAYIVSLRAQLGQPTGVGMPFIPSF